MVSLKPSEMTSGGAPVDRNMLIKSARFGEFQYTKKDGSPALKADGTPAITLAAELVLVEDDGTEHNQNYSVGDPARYEVLDDGKRLGPENATITTSCNLHILLNGMVNAGFPENKLSDDLSAIEGLYAYWIGVPEPERAGLSRGGAGQQKRVIPVPSQIHKLPWEKAKPGMKIPTAVAKPASGAKTAAGTATKAAGVTKKAATVSQDVLDSAVDFVGKIVDETGSTTRQDLAARVFTDLAKDPNRDTIAAAIFSPAMQASLLANGFAVDGEDISRAE